MRFRPESNEYNAYFKPYVDMVPEGDIIEILVQQEKETKDLLKKLTDEEARFRYEAHKWSIKQLIGHVADTERVMSYRLLAIARGDTTPLPGFDQDAYVEQAAFDEWPLEELLKNFSAVRASTVHLLKGLRDADWTKMGEANQSPLTVRALAYIIAGHERHHRNIIQTRYLQSPRFPHA